MSDALYSVPRPENEPVLSYAPGTSERDDLKAKLDEMASRRIEIPVIIGGREIRTERTAEAAMPHDHRHVLATWHLAGRREIEGAIEAARKAWREWSEWEWEERAAVFLRAAELLSGPWRTTLNAATMLGQSKTAHQAEIDSACELADFWRFNVHFATRIYAEQPFSRPGAWNRMDYRPLEGFIYAVTPFNFTAIGGNLPTAPALMGNVAIWKPSPKSMLSNYYVMKLLEEAGLPGGVVNFVPGDPVEVSRALVASPDFAGLHYTGSSTVLRSLWRQIAENIETYRGYPRIVSESGGKDFLLAHASARRDALAVALVRGAFEYQGQKCSAVSRAFIPRSIWPEVRDRVLAMMRELRMGDPRDFRNFLCAVIDRGAFEKIEGYLAEARESDAVEILAGGKADDRCGFFVEPTLALVRDPDHRVMREEIFGPVLAVHVFEDERWDEVVERVDTGTPYGLTGAVFAEDRRVVRETSRRLRHAAGNYYVNDKPTGAVVGQQPFGGGRASGTNDKAGSLFNLVRWVSPRAIKETYDPPTDYRYPFMEAK